MRDAAATPGIAAGPARRRLDRPQLVTQRLAQASLQNTENRDLNPGREE
jgi:hypothetical protein